MSADLDPLLAAAVRGDETSARRLVQQDPDAVCARAEYHGLLPLVAGRLSRVEGVPAGLQSRFALCAARQVAADLIQEDELRSALPALADAGVRALLLKGAHLAYVCYERPDLRPRLDTDLLIEPACRAAAADALAALGYEAAPTSGGELISYQAAFVKWRDGRRRHVIDVHWRIANPQVFAGLFTFDELASKAVPIDALGPHARGLSAPHALLVACIHRVAHHADSNRLIWLYDIDRLASILTAADWERVIALAADRKVAAVCRRSLDRAAQHFLTAVPSHVRSDPRLWPAAGEATAAFTRPGRRPLDQVASDIQALPSWRDRLRLVREHLFPSGQYMREVYAASSRAPLPLLYASRAVRGAWRWLDRAPAHDDGVEHEGRSL